jgi:hypothetical protein
VHRGKARPQFFQNRRRTDAQYGIGVQQRRPKLDWPAIRIIIERKPSYRLT